MKLDHRLEDGVWVIEGEGHLDAGAVENLHELIQSVFERGCFRLCFDFSAIDSVSSAGAGLLLAAEQRARLEGGGAVVLNPGDKSREVLDTLGVSKVLQVVPDRRAAWAVLER